MHHLEVSQPLEKNLFTDLCSSDLSRNLPPNLPVTLAAQILISVVSVKTAAFCLDRTAPGAQCGCEDALREKAGELETSVSLLPLRIFTALKPALHWVVSRAG